MSDIVDIVDLKETVCKTETVKNGKRFGGHGVLLQPDILLTSWHIINGAEKIIVRNGLGEEARPVRGDFNVRDKSLDLAIMELSKPLSRKVAVHTSTDTHLHNMAGFLVTRFTGKATVHKIGIDRSRTILDFQEVASGQRSYVADIQVGPGYSGSPIFDARGRLGSILAGNAEVMIGNKLVVPENGYSCFGVSPFRLAAFIQKTLG